MSLELGVRSFWQQLVSYNTITSIPKCISSLQPNKRLLWNLYISKKLFMSIRCGKAVETLCYDTNGTSCSCRISFEKIRISQRHFVIIQMQVSLMYVCMMCMRYIKPGNDSSCDTNPYSINHRIQNVFIQPGS